ncbi:Chromosomal organization and DNA repair protein [Neofusicoccum parvum]|uniref:Chromosomal organization and DNA repair protein n=1 Tax=Neofusicoccum parvum TaxID=310453 RepID=A0ACB5SLL8_9PEZI|nr:Chromosomal organization and DNA repair protein [Neofusicoccum parvum]
MALPTYQAPEYPMNAAGQRALHNMLQSHNHRKLEEHLRQAALALNSNVLQINERLTDRKGRDLKRKQKHPDSLTEVDEQRARHLDDFDTRVTAMTKRMEETVRKTIDAQHVAGLLQDSVEHVEAQAAANATASQRLTQTQRRRGDGDDDEMTEYDPTLPGETQQVQAIVPKNIFQQRLQAQKDKYQSLSHPIRYSEHNDYISFKKSVYDGQYLDGKGPGVPDPSRWFTSTGAPAPGITEARGDDSDDDIAIAGERISTKCPLTLQELKDPLTSTKCPHTFERYAIQSYLPPRHDVGSS